MPTEPRPLQVFPAEVTATDPENRVISVKFLGLAEIGNNVIVLNDSGNYSFPRVGERGLVLDAYPYYYYLGKIEYRYKEQIEGAVDRISKVNINAKKVAGGETWIGSVIKKAWLYIANSGNFSLMNGLNDGLKYFAQSRFLRLAAGVVNLVGSGAYVAFGSVIRDIPGVGKTPIPSDIPTIPSVEGLIDIVYNNLKLARLHIGHVMNTTLGTPEISSFGTRLRAILEVATGGVTLAVLKMDETGNIELSTVPTGKVMLNGNPVGGIMLSGLGSAFSGVLGEKLTSYLLAHTHGSPAGNTSPPLPVAGFAATLTDLLSTMVKLN